MIEIRPHKQFDSTHTGISQQLMKPKRIDPL